MNLLVRISEFFHRLSTGRITLAAVVLFVVFGATVLPSQSRRAKEASGGAASPDTSFIYSPQDLYRMAEAYGPEGRQAYIQARIAFDLPFPIVYLLFLGTSISWLLRKGVMPGRAWLRTNVLPAIGFVFDLLENAAASLVMGRYPAPTPVVDVLAPVFTVAKWVFVGGSVVLLVIAAVLALANRARQSRSSG